MRRCIFLFALGLLLLLGGIMIFYPYERYRFIQDELIVSIGIYENLLGFRDPEYRKRLIIQDGNEKFEIFYWSEIKELSLMKRSFEGQEFWVVQDDHRGLTRTRIQGFSDFTCMDCLGAKELVGENIIVLEFKEGDWLVTSQSR